VSIPFGEVLRALFLSGATEEVWNNILIGFRLPRAVNAIVSGAALGTCGLMLQTLFRNPLADPFVLGVAHASRLGVALLVVGSGVAGNAFAYRYGLLGDIGMAAASSIGAVLALGVLASLARRVSGTTLLITGLMLGYLCVGLISAALHFVDETQAEAFQGWDDGSFAGATRKQLSILVPCCIAGLALALIRVKHLNALLLGDGYARSMGAMPHRTRQYSMVVVGLLCGTVTAFCGPISFLGLIAAQLARGWFQSADHRILVPGVAVVGATLALAADLITHLPWSRHVFHLNAVNGLIGAPVALWALYRSRVMRQLD
jgi:iron complex transport system permease protein